MKAATFKKYGPPEVLRVEEIKTPTPKAHEVLIKIHATTVTSADCRLRAAKAPPGFGLFIRLAFGIFGPRKHTLGGELSGVIEAVGQDVTQFKVGDEVFAFTGANFGAYAEYTCMAEDGPIALKPTNMSHEEAAGISFGGTTALYFLRDRAGIKPGQKLLINGASGGVGTQAIQIARYFGAEVTAVCSAGNAQMVRDLGADHTIDYHQRDFTQEDTQYDVVLDIIGNISFSRCKRVLTPDGKLLAIAAGLPTFLTVLWTSLFSRKKVIGGVAPETAEDLRFLKDMAEDGKLITHIDRRYPLEMIADAHRYADTGRKKGQVVIQTAA